MADITPDVVVSDIKTAANTKADQSAATRALQDAYDGIKSWQQTPQQQDRLFALNKSLHDQGLLPGLTIEDIGSDQGFKVKDSQGNEKTESLDQLEGQLRAGSQFSTDGSGKWSMNLPDGTQTPLSGKVQDNIDGSVTWTNGDSTFIKYPDGNLRRDDGGTGQTELFQQNNGQWRVSIGTTNAIDPTSKSFTLAGAPQFNNQGGITYTTLDSGGNKLEDVTTSADGSRSTTVHHSDGSTTAYSYALDQSNKLQIVDIKQRDATGNLTVEKKNHGNGNWTETDTSGNTTVSDPIISVNVDKSGNAVYRYVDANTHTVMERDDDATSGLTTYKGKADGVPQDALTPAPDGKPAVNRNYQIKQGDTLWQIATDLLTAQNKQPSAQEVLSEIQAIAVANTEIRDPNIIYCGHVLYIPPLTPSQIAACDAANSGQQQPQVA